MGKGRVTGRTLLARVERDPDPGCDDCGGAGLASEQPDDGLCFCCWNEFVEPSTADHVADLVALPPAERVARLVALLRACPDEAVEAVRACKVAHAWSEAWRMPLRGGQYVATIHWADDGDGEWWWERPQDRGVHGPLPTEAEAQAAADAALLADGWVLASGVKP